MNPIKQIIAIAEYCGYKNLKHIDAPDCSMADGVWADNPTYPSRGVPSIKVPRYLTDLNDIHELEKTLTDEQYNIFALHLGPLTTIRRREYISATASQRAEAFLKTIGKWE